LVVLLCAAAIVIVGFAERADSKSITLKSAPLPGRKRTAHHPLGMTFEYETPVVPEDQPPLGTEVLEYSIKAKVPGRPSQRQQLL
jgi:hypothetical protein